MISQLDLKQLGEKYRLWAQAHPPGSAAAHAYHMCAAEVTRLEQRELNAPTNTWTQRLEVGPDGEK